MKRAVSILLVLFMILSLTSCGTKGKGKPSENTGRSAGMANPWADTDSDTVFSKTGFRFSEPENASDIVYRYNESAGLAEMQFTLNKTEWCARVKKGESPEDISGMNYEWTESFDVSMAYNGSGFKGSGYCAPDDGGRKTAYCGQWFHEKEQYNLSLSAVSDESNEDIAAVAAAVFLSE